MRNENKIPINWKATLALSLCLLLGIAFGAQASDLPGGIQEMIEQRFPGASIKETRRDTWKGRSVMEAELTSGDGGNYEVIISDGLEILSVKEEKGLPLIGGELSLGVGTRVEREIYKGVGTETQPELFLLYENGPMEIRASDGVEVAFELYETDAFSIAFLGTMEMEAGYDADDSNFLESMDELHTLYGAGLAFGKKSAGWEAGLEVLQDISGEHGGQEVALSLGYPWMVAGLELRPELSLTWMSGDTVDYFFGVSPREARGDRPAYSPGSSFEIGARLMIRKEFFENFSAVCILESSVFGKEVTGSPLVERDYEIWSLLGIIYTF